MKSFPTDCMGYEVLFDTMHDIFRLNNDKDLNFKQLIKGERSNKVITFLAQV